MLDIFSNVFGKSKKSGTNLTGSAGNDGSPSTSRQDGNNQSDNEPESSFSFVTPTSLNDSSASVYPTILTNEMIRSPNGPPAWNPSPYQNQPQSSNPQASSQPNFPFQQPQASGTFLRRQASSNLNPLDDVPFSLSSSNVAILSVGSQATDLGKCFQVVDRVGTFLSTASQSDYNFSLETSVVRESHATAGGQF